MNDPFASVRDKRMSELTDEQKDLAHELWLREQMGPNWPLRETLEAVLRVVDRLRVDAERWRFVREGPSPYHRLVYDSWGVQTDLVGVRADEVIDKARRLLTPT